MSLNIIDEEKKEFGSLLTDVPDFLFLFFGEKIFQVMNCNHATSIHGKANSCRTGQFIIKLFPKARPINQARSHSRR